MPTPMPKPSPPKPSVCRRHQADGTACDAPTRRPDGWCGTCDGFTSAHPLSAPRRRVRPSIKRTWNPVNALPLTSEAASSFRMTRVVLDTFAARHRCTVTEAEAEIASMITGMLRDPDTEYGRCGDERLWSMRHSGYTLLFSPTLDAVVGYSTSHRERTWAQVQAGTPSRITEGQEGRSFSGPAWYYAMESSTGLPARCLYSTATLYVHVAKGGKLKQATAGEYLPEMVTRLKTALAQWDGSDGRFFLSDDHQEAPLSWLLVKEPGAMGVLVTILSPERRAAAAA